MFLFFTEIKPWQALTLPTFSLSLDPEVIFTFLLRSAAHHLCFPFRPKILSWPLTLPSCLSSSTSRLSALTSCSWQSLSRLVKPSTTQSPSLGRSRASARHPCSSKLAVWFGASLLTADPSCFCIEPVLILSSSACTGSAVDCWSCYSGLVVAALVFSPFLALFCAPTVPRAGHLQPQLRLTSLAQVSSVPPCLFWSVMGWLCCELSKFDSSMITCLVSSV